MPLDLNGWCRAGFYRWMWCLIGLTAALTSCNNRPAPAAGQATSSTREIPPSTSGASPVSQPPPRPVDTAALPEIPTVVPAGATAPAASRSLGTEPAGDWLHQPFADAVSAEVPSDALPPLRTRTGLSVGKLASEVERLWPGIRFRRSDGTAVQYQVTLSTARGSLVIDLWPDIAPNHCRNFIALCQAGYFNGLLLEARSGSPEELNSPRLVVGGSPEGNSREQASLGYWLRPEILTEAEAGRRQVKHIRGVVGAWRSPRWPDAAGCMFYICLTDAPDMDGAYTLFGRVQEGLSVVDELYSQAVGPQAGLLWPFTAPLTIERAAVLSR